MPYIVLRPPYIVNRIPYLSQNFTHFFEGAFVWNRHSHRCSASVEERRYSANLPGSSGWQRRAMIKAGGRVCACVSMSYKDTRRMSEHLCIWSMSLYHHAIPHAVGMYGAPALQVVSPITHIMFMTIRLGLIR